MFGILPPHRARLLDGVPVWSFDDKFDPVSPWSQRAMLNICGDTTSELKVMARNCWIEDFRDWLRKEGTSFPVQRFGNFHEELKRFREQSAAASAMMWLDEDEQIRGTVFSIKVLPGSDQQDTIDIREHWLLYIAAKNSEPSTADSQAWATSQAWVDAEAYSEALKSTWTVTLVATACIFLAGLLYTLDVEVMAMVLAITVAACAYLSFFMFCLFGWSFGPWELLLMFIAFAYSVEPIFRIGRNFTAVPKVVRLQGGAGAGVGDELVQRGTSSPTSPSSPTVAAAVSTPSSSSRQIEAHTSMSSLRVQQGSSEQVDDGVPKGDSFGVSNDGEVGLTGDNWDESPKAVLARSINNLTAATLSSALKLFWTGIFLLPCRFRLFQRLGAVGMVLAFLMVPVSLVLLPAAILFSGRTRREPDVKPMARWLYDLVSWMWT